MAQGQALDIEEKQEDLQEWQDVSVPNVDEGVKGEEEVHGIAQAEAPASEAGSSQWRLSASLTGHTSDVKALFTSVVAHGTREAIFSVSRDSTARVWTRAIEPHRGSRDDDKAEPWIEGPTFFGGGRFLNSLVVVPGRTQEEADSLVVGGLDGLIRCFNLPEDLTQPAENTEPERIVQEHYDNVTALRYAAGAQYPPAPTSQQDQQQPQVGPSTSGHHAAAAAAAAAPLLPSSAPQPDLLLSSSWDCTARSFRRDVKGKWHRHHLLKGHSSAVWGVEIVSADLEAGERYLTASADLFIRLFEQEELKVVWAGHEDVVRDLRLLPLPVRSGASADSSPRAQTVLFASSSNDPDILVHSLSPDARPPGVPTNGGEAVLTLRGHTSIVYSLALLQLSKDNDDESGRQLLLLSASEDGTVRVWDYSHAARGNDTDPSDHGSAAPLLHTIKHPGVSSVWTCAALPATGCVISGSNDGVVRVFTPNADAD